jgi:hypothetical protein
VELLRRKFGAPILVGTHNLALIAVCNFVGFAHRWNTFGSGAFMRPKYRDSEARSEVLGKHLTHA